MVRFGLSPSCFISRTASHAATLQPPSSIAPCPTSHESMCPPSTTTSSGFSDAAQLGDDVARRRVGQHLRVHLQRHDDLVAAILHAMQHLGVLDAERRRRQLRERRVVARRAGVRILNRERRDRADEHGDRADLRRRRRRPAAIDVRLAIALEARLVGRERMVEQHDLPLRFGGAPRAAPRSCRPRAPAP